MKRIFLFALTNIFVMITLSILIAVLGIGPYLTESGIDYYALALFCLVWGMGGAFISLAMSRFMAKMAMGVQVIDPDAPGQFAWLVQRIHALSRDAGLSRMPQVGVYNSPEINAFATGPTKARSLVAVSAGLLQNMSQDEIEGVLAHEVAHIQNGDMVTMTLIQGVINAFVMFFARVIAFVLTSRARGQSRYMYSRLITVVLEVVLGLLGFIIVCWFSRQREFRADRGSAKLLGGEQKMIAALQALMGQRGMRLPEQAPSLATMKIYGKEGGFAALFSTHPPLERRIQALANRT